MGGWAVNQVAPRIGMIRPELIAKSVQDFFMRSPMQRKYAAKAAHGARGEQGKNPPLLDCPEFLHLLPVVRRLGIPHCFRLKSSNVSMLFLLLCDQFIMKAGCEESNKQQCINRKTIQIVRQKGIKIFLKKPKNVPRTIRLESGHNGRSGVK